MRVNCFLLKPLSLVLLSFLWIQLSLAQDVDTDGDGLSDFHEIHKHLTDPKNPDSDGDGVYDNDWKERREYQYTVRCVVQVMKPVTIEFLNNDYQDTRLLDETDTYVELEVIHYPFNTVASAIRGDKKWRETVQDPERELSKWLQPGPTSDWTPKLSKDIESALKKDGIELSKLDDLETVNKVSKWLLSHAEYQDGFSCFATAFDENGKPFIPDYLEEHVGKNSELTVAEQWEREISATGMFHHRQRGSCSSSAIFLNGCLRAVGIPTRTVLCIPIVDAGDDSEMGMIRRLKHPQIRRDLLNAMTPMKNSWASHTFNEVYVGERWRRLNYGRIGQNNYDPGLFGLMTHVATFHDWADARMSETIGRRQALGGDDVFGGSNPYSTLSLRDELGKHCKMEMPTEATETRALVVEKILWTDSEELPEDIRENCRRRERFGLIADVTGFRDRSEIKNFLAQADLRVFLDVDSDEREKAEQSDKQAMRLGIGFDTGCYWLYEDKLRIYVPFGLGDRRDLVQNVTYSFRPRNNNEDFLWKVPNKLSITRTQ